MTFGLDTNVLLRLILEDDPRQTAMARRLVDSATAKGSQFYVTTIAMCEAVWVMRSAYKMGRKDTAEVVDTLLRLPYVLFEDRSSLYQALLEYKSGTGYFAYYLIGQQSRAAGCSATYTFDKALDPPLFELLR